MRAATLACLAALGLLAGGCGGDRDPGRDGAAGPAVGAPIPTQPDRGSESGYPAGIAHAFGLTEVKRTPKRVVTLGINDQDWVLALGFKPIAVADVGNGEPFATRPWSRMLLGDAKPKLLDAREGWDFREVAALKPDLIVATNAGLTAGEYDRFSKIAPTLGPDGVSSDGYTSYWNSTAQTIGAGFDRMDQVDALVLDTQRRFAAVAAKHPEFAGKTATLVDGTGAARTLRARPDHGPFEALSMLGFDANTKLAPPEQPPGRMVDVVPERLRLIDTDVAVFASRTTDGVQSLKQVPGFGDLRAVQGGRAVYADAALSDAVLYPTPLSLRYALDHLTPKLAAAVRGDAPDGVADGT